MTRYLRFLWSLKFAVIVLLSLATALTVGTVLESRYDAQTAEFWVYGAAWFHGVLFALGVNILLVALSRWPWRRQHLPFLAAHAGILLLLAGAFVSRVWGLDGHVLIAENDKESLVQTGRAEVAVTGENRSFVKEIHWRPPNAGFSAVRLPEFGLTIDSFLAHAEIEREFVADESPSGLTQLRHQPALQIELKAGPSESEPSVFWLWAGSARGDRARVGPLEVSLAAAYPPALKEKSPRLVTSAASLHFAVTKDGMLEYSYEGFDDSRGKTRSLKGKLKTGQAEGKSIVLGGAKMRLVVTVKRLHAHARLNKIVKPSRRQYGDEATPSAIRLNSSYWLGLGEQASVMLGSRRFTVAYRSQSEKLPFELKLRAFNIDYDPGAATPSSYASAIEVIEGNAVVHSTEVRMNRPLKWRGYTFYQSSFDMGPGRATATILSVNRDPGRWLKYLGSLALVAGTVALFAIRRGRPVALTRGGAMT